MDHPHMGSMAWSRFAAMIAVSTAVMFLLSYQLVYAADHATFSLTRLLSAFVMGAVMTGIMLAFMWKMYAGQGIKVAVLVGAGLAAIALLAVNRNQMLVDDTTFMKSMIPHHSVAINNARKARISDPRVRALADRIITSQVREIAEMKALVRDIEVNGKRGDTPIAPVAATVTPAMQPEIENAVR